ncbi:restriction endonuclease [Enterobacter sp. ECC-175]|uniref:restriction endonuclease n=1 Tax=Enterobacter sp. ECC-175 TaxID=3116479 RepID=UPI0026379C8B|nr:restriction endonuclease [uncultured Enterobacter sp.]
MEFNFDALDPTKFEEFCYDLLSSLSPAQLDWRKGTPLGSSPSDRGRDLEATFLKTEIDGSQIFEKWHIECKHYEKGVPPDKLHGVLSWAMAVRPDVLLIIASGYLSNACKEHLELFKANNKPPFRLLVWERKKLESLTSGNFELRAKYGLTKELSFMRLINNYHAEYTLNAHFNTIPFFLSAMDELEDDLRREVFGLVFMELIKPRFRLPNHPDEKIANLMLDKVDYSSYKNKLLSYREGELPTMYVFNAVSYALGYYFSLSNIDSITPKVERLDAAIKYMKEKEPSRSFDFIIEHRNSLADKTKLRYVQYHQICNSFVKKLLSETPAL